MDDLEKTLNELALAMDDHRQVLAGKGSARRGATPRPVVPSDSRMALVERLLAEIEAHAGLKVDDNTKSKLRSVLASVDVAELGSWVTDLEALDRAHPDWLTLIESLTTNETYLFRDFAQLELLRMAGLPPVIAANRRTAHPKLRLWSAGCASGEEAYSLAVLALQAMIDSGAAHETTHEIVLSPSWSLEVLGTDISRPMLVLARNALYGTGSLSPFRAVPQPLLRFFPVAAPTTDGESGRTNRQVRRDIRSHVHFTHANLLRNHPPARSFDVVACRNVLVYFAPAARKVAQSAIEAAVRVGGILLLGPTDSPPDPRHFEEIWGTNAVIYRRRA
jgi:chemotaxis protein methyltransferase CheR